MDYGKLTLEEIKKGFRFNKKDNTYVCNYCDKAFSEGQVYSIDGNLYLSKQAVIRHIEIEHGGNVEQLLNSDTKYNTLTDNQKELLLYFYSDIPDSEIAKKLGVSNSTVRHQKFTFREKAKQAKLYLAVFENIFQEKRKNEETIIPIHNNAAYYDDRYIITEQEKNHILETSFESLSPLRLKVFPRKEKKKVVILAKIAEQFEVGEKYTEKEIDEMIKPVFDDYVLIRRYLIMYGFMDRTKDGTSYWLTN